MMKKNSTIPVFALMACLFLVGDVGAQTQRKAFKYDGGNFINQQKLLLERGVSWKRSPFEHRNGDFIAISIVWYSQNWNDEIDKMDAIFNGGSPNYKRVNMHEDGHVEGKQGKYVSELYFCELDIKSFGVNCFGSASIDSLEIHFFDPGLTPKLETRNPKPSISDLSACPCPQPAFEGRLDWCPDGSCPPDPTPEFVPNPTHIIIHHSAGPNVATDWAAVVRSFWDYHVNVNGWDDIGYNWLVDPNGVLYEGRGDGRLGAHFCAQNGNTIGICVIGDFTDTQPTDEAIGELEDYLAWDCCDKNISPLDTGFHSGSGLVLPFISGHRDGCMTSCPGDAFYPLLPEVRQATQDRIDSGCGSGVVAAPTVLAITYVGASKISLSWQDNAVGETGYSIERSETTDDNFSQIVQLPGNAMAFSDNNVSPDNTYFYRVRAKQGTEFSAYSNVAVAVTSLSATESRLHGGTASLYPNPTTGFLNLSIDNQWVGQTELFIFDAMGRLAIGPFFEEKNSGEANFKLDLGELPAGIFMMKMTQGEEVGWFRVVKN